MHLAVQINAKPVCKLLFKYPGVNFNIQNNHGNTALHNSVNASSDLIILQDLLTLQNLNVNARNLKEQTPLLLAALQARKHAVKLIAAHRESEFVPRDFRTLESAKS